VIHRQRRSARAARGQTRAYADRVSELASLLRYEIGCPEVPHGHPALVVLMGEPGVGKTHCARLLAPRLGAAHIASDHLRSRLFIAASYAAEENALIFRAADAVLERLLVEGHRVVLDATNLLRRNRETAIAAARRAAVPCVFVRIVAPEAEIRARLGQRAVARAAHDFSDADERVFERLRTYEPPGGAVLVVRNCSDLDGDLAAVVAAVEAAC
jgi:predicted kinase